MTRTRKGAKGPGHEYWGRRPGGGPHGQVPGPLAKRVTHRAERAEGKREAVEREPDVHPRELEQCQGCAACVCVKCGGVVVHNGELDVFQCLECWYAPPEANDDVE